MLILPSKRLALPKKRIVLPKRQRGFLNLPAMMMKSQSVVPTMLTKIGTHTDSADRTTYTFTDKPIGSADADRVVVVCTFGGSSRTVSSVTIGGVTATQLVAANTVYPVTIHALNVASGTTATIVVTYSGGNSRCGIWVGNLLGTGGSVTAHDTATDTDSSDPLTASINVPAGGSCLAISGAGTEVTGNVWTGLTEDSDVDVESNNRMSVAKDDFSSAQFGLSVSTNLTYSIYTSGGLAVASWGP